MSQTLTNNLVIATRFNSKYTAGVTSESLHAYIKYLRSFKPQRLICNTSPEEGYMEDLKSLCDEVLTYGNMSYKKPIEEFYRQGRAYHLLIISYGVVLEKWQLEHGFDLLRSRNLLCAGWKILQQENDGSYPGKLSYNTCMLHEPLFHDMVLEAGGIPEYVENGILGSATINLDGKQREIKIGGQEDLAIQLKIYKHYHGKKHKLFGHITHYGLDYPTQAPAETGFNEKLVRKVMTAEVYRKVEDVNPRNFMDSWVII